MCLRPRADGSPEKVGKMSETVSIGYTGPERDRNSQAEKLRMYVHLLENRREDPACVAFWETWQGRFLCLSGQLFSKKLGYDSDNKHLAVMCTAYR